LLSAAFDNGAWFQLTLYRRRPMNHSLKHPFAPSIVAVSIVAAQGAILLSAFAALASIALFSGGGFLSTP
jgi:hypothetical protein